jgi:beta-1,4-mannooligosaccharide/beta-1,4-mannosyl-N-acetylglucosamine phosphorylase
VLFPERLGGRYLRLDRPNVQHTAGEPTSGDQICLSQSSDLVSWKRVGTVARGRQHYWDERIGCGPPPVTTSEGWLHVYHVLQPTSAATTYTRQAPCCWI